jgi:hypothetical protein
MKKAPPKVRLSEHIAEDAQIELLYAAAEAHPNWEVIPDGMGIRHIGSQGPDTPQKLLDWFKRKGRH